MKANINENEKSKISVTDVVTEWLSDRNTDEFLDKIIRRKYVPFADKIRLARFAQSVAHTVRNDKGDVLGYEMDALQTYFQNIIAIIDSYTNIDISNGDTVQNYDALQEHGIVKFVLDHIGDDLAEWTRVWNLASDDFYQKHFTTRGWLDSVWQKIIGGLARLRGSVASALNSAIEANPELAETLKASGVDISTLVGEDEPDEADEEESEAQE